LAPSARAPRRGPGGPAADPRRPHHLVSPRRAPDHHAPRGRCRAPCLLPRPHAARDPRDGAPATGRRAGRRPRRGARMTSAVAVCQAEGARRRLSDYLALTKPRVVAMVLVTTAVGYHLGSAGSPALL